MGHATAILLDTDIGSDIDDAVALAYLLRQPRCELLGITTVTGDVAKRAALVRSICGVAGRSDIPIHCGAPQPLIGVTKQPHVPQYEAIERSPDALLDFEPGTAVEFLRRTIRSRPGEITLLTIGPLTNIAMLFRLDPEIPSMIREIVMMAGVFFGGSGQLEWNAMLDPVATASVVETPAVDIRVFGLDVTMRCSLDASTCRSRFASFGAIGEKVMRVAKSWFDERQHLIFHDPLAAAAIFEPSLCDYRRGVIGAEHRSPNFGGLTNLNEMPESVRLGRHQVANTVRADAFFDHYFNVLGG